MRILLAASVDPTVPNASVTHLDGVATELTRLGHNVSLVLPRPRHGSVVLDPATVPYGIEYASYGAGLGISRFASFAVQAPWLAWRNLSGTYDLVYIRSGVLSFTLSFMMRLFGRVPVVTEHNGWMEDELRVQGRGPLVRQLVKWIQVLDARCSTRIRCVTAGLAAKFRQAGIAEHKLVVIGNGTDLGRFHPMPREQALREWDLPEDRFYLGFIGSLAPWHGLTMAVQAMPAILAACPNACLLIAGEGAQRRQAEEMAGQLGIADRVQFLGHVPAARAPSIINCFDLALAPFVSERNNSIGLSALKVRDYAACGRAILSTEIEGVAPPDDRDWISICAPDDPDAIAAEAIRLIASAEERARLGQAARTYAENHFGWRPLVARILEAAFEPSR